MYYNPWEDWKLGSLLRLAAVKSAMYGIDNITTTL